MYDDVIKFRDVLKKFLRNGSIQIVFYKADGTERKMHCTLHPKLIPDDKLPKSGIEADAESSVIRVFDLEKNDWRSFRSDSVISYVFIEENKND